MYTRVVRAAVAATVMTMAGTLLLAPSAGADGSEMLGVPSIAIAAGSGIAIGGVGLEFTPNGVINVDVPPGASVVQVLVYWQGDNQHGQAADDTLVVGGFDVTGTKIGGDTVFFNTPALGEVVVASFRADITSLGLIGAGANAVEVSGLTNNRRNDGAGIAAIYDDGTVSDIELRDGLDMAFINFPSPFNATVPQTYNYPASASERVATLDLFVGSVSDTIPRPNALDLTTDGITTRLTNVFSSADGAQWDSVSLPVTLPAGSTSLTVEPLSVGDGSGSTPASLGWVMSGLTIPVPTPPGSGCSLTQGYWKTHSEFGPAPYDATWAMLPDGAATDFFDTGISWKEMFDTRPRGSAYPILAHQWMAATLNGFAGADTSVIAADLVEARDLLDTYDGNPQPTDSISRQVRKDFIALAGTLDDYNNGLIGPGHCD